MNCRDDVANSVRRPCPAGMLLSAAELPDARDAASREAIQLDWMRQDYAQATLAPALEQQKDDWRKTYLKSLESRHDDPVLPQLAVLRQPG